MSTSHTGDYCQHKDKMCMTREEANAAVRSISKGKNKMISYLCEHCGRWHVAHARSASHRGLQRSRSHGKSKGR